MLPTEPGVRLAVGLPRSGKTYGIRRDLFAAARAYPVLVVDRTFEWRRPPYNRVPAELADVTAHAATVAEAAAMVDKGKRLVIVSTSDDVARVAVEALKWAKHYPGQSGVAVSEAHHAFPVHMPLAGPAMDAATAHRHFQVSLWLDTQRLALVARTFDLAALIRIYSAPDSDLPRLRSIGGAALVSAVRECAVRNAAVEHGGWGEPGWHVALYEGVRPKRYQPTRES